MKRAIVWLALLLNVPSTAMAGDDHADAKRFFRAGAQAYQSGQYEIATRALENAYALSPIPEVAFSLAQAYRLRYVTDRKASYLVRAKSLYDEYLAATPQGGRRHDAVTALAEIGPLLIGLEGGRAATVVEEPTQVLVTTQVDGAKARIDDGPFTPIPTTVELEPGSHRVVVTAPGHAEQTLSVVAVKGRLVVSEVELEPLLATIRIRGDCTASMYVDGTFVSETPGNHEVRVPAGDYRVALVANGRHRWDRSLSLGRGEEATVEAELETTAQRYLAWTLIGASAVSVLSGSLVGLSALSTNARAKALEDQRHVSGLTALELSQYEQDRSRRTELRGAAITMLATGVVVGTSGLLLYVFDQPTYVAPQTHQLGVTVGGRF